MRTGRLQHLLLGHEQGIAIRLAAHRRGVILPAQGEADGARRRARDLMGAVQRAGRLDEGEEAQRAMGDAAALLEPGDELVEQAQMVRPLDLGDDQTVDARQHRRLQVAHRELERLVDADQDVGAAFLDQALHRAGQ